MYSMSSIKAVVVPQDHVFVTKPKPLKRSSSLSILFTYMCPRRRRGFLPTFYNEELDKVA
jgi:hypothetical protein